MTQTIRPPERYDSRPHQYSTRLDNSFLLSAAPLHIAACSVDPLFGKLADAWMQQLCADFGCGQNVAGFQLDGYFDGGTAPWKIQGVGSGVPRRGGSNQAQNQQQLLPSPDLPACTFSAPQVGYYLAGCDSTNCASYSTLAAAEAACSADTTCGGITSPAGGKGPFEIREGSTPMQSPDNEVSWTITNPTQCRPPPPPLKPDPVWRERGAAAYAGLTRTVPNATWYFQGEWDKR